MAIPLNWLFDTRGCFTEEAREKKIKRWEVRWTKPHIHQTWLVDYHNYPYLNPLENFVRSFSHQSLHLVRGFPSASRRKTARVSPVQSLGFTRLCDFDLADVKIAAPMYPHHITMDRSTIFNGKTHYFWFLWQFSIAMLVYQRVHWCSTPNFACGISQIMWLQSPLCN